MTAVLAMSKIGRTLIPDALFERLSKRIAQEHHVDKDHADRIMDQVLAFLGTCATTDELLSPSEAVDIGWHTFILYTHDYAAFCERVADRFIHHVPTDDEEAAAHGSDARAAIQHTVGAISRAGFRVDRDLWNAAGSSGTCSQCHQGCTDSP